MFGLWIEAVGILFTAVCLYSILRSRDSKSWPPTPARVIRGKLEDDNDGGYESVITFHYSVGGRRYEKTDTFTSYPPTEGRAKRTCASTRQGERWSPTTIPRGPTMRRYDRGTSSVIGSG